MAKFIGFGIKRNLLYFIVKDNEKEPECITQTAIFCFTAWVAGFVIIILIKNIILDRTSYDFIFPLILYLLFFINMDFWEEYWLGKKRSDNVLYYTVIRTSIRMTVIILTAYFTRDLNVVIWSLVIVEAIRFSFVFIFFTRIKRFTKKLDFGLMKQQLSFIIPLGIASTIYYANSRLGHLFISVNLGASFLAIYSIGSYQLPFLNVIRYSVGDVIFPEMVQRNVKDPIQGLKLWQKKNIVFCILVFPFFIIFFYYTDIFIKTLFTEAYAEATAIFRIYLFFMLRQCFEMSSPLRSININKHFILGNSFALVINFVLMFTLYKLIGFAGPALAFILSDLALALYIAILISKIYKVRIKTLFMLKKVFKIVAVALVCIPVLFLGELFSINEIFKASAFSIFYLAIYTFIIYFSKFEEINVLFFKIKQIISNTRN
jgi:O-antigen/teichoic acid export membrane protein